MNYPDSILNKVQKPARYTGGEWNSIIKRWEESQIHVALSYPDTYEVGMSSITIPILYQFINQLPGIAAERVYAPWPDMEQALRQARIDLKSLETGHALSEFELIGFSLGYELTYSNLLNILDLGRIPVRSCERKQAFPLIMAGGIGTLNPEPLADFIDFFVIGDGEELIGTILSLLREHKKHSTMKKQVLLELATIEGIYVPSLYTAEYSGSGQFKAIKPVSTGVPLPVRRSICQSLPPAPSNPPVPLIETAQDRAIIEINRGCTRGCRFCNAGIYYRPLRYRQADDIIDTLSTLSQTCGYDEVTLLSLSAGDYPDIDVLLHNLNRIADSNNITISLPSLRVDSYSLALIESLSSKRKSGLTLAPEAATMRLQQVINKVIPEEDILKTAARAFERGWSSLKLYFMLGLPTEQDEDLAAIGALANKIHDLGQLSPGRRPHLRISLSTFIPKAHTPFQWAGQIDADEIKRRIDIVKHNTRRNIKISWQAARTSMLEALLSRGDRRLGNTIYQAWKLGARFDGWEEFFNFSIWEQAIAMTNIEPSVYVNRERSLDEPLPWDHIDLGVSKHYLLNEYSRALQGIVTPDCRTGRCNLCGLEQRAESCRNKTSKDGKL